MTIHNHGAAVSGVKSEKKMAVVVESKGHTILKTEKDFKKAGLGQWGRVFHKPPY